MLVTNSPIKICKLLTLLNTSVVGMVSSLEMGLKSSFTIKMVIKVDINNMVPTNKKTSLIPNHSAKSPPKSGPINIPPVTPVAKVPKAYPDSS